MCTGELHRQTKLTNYVDFIRMHSSFNIIQTSLGLRNIW